MKKLALVVLVCVVVPLEHAASGQQVHASRTSPLF
jgi:hypothetical protein